MNNKNYFWIALFIFTILAMIFGGCDNKYIEHYAKVYKIETYRNSTIFCIYISDSYDKYIDTCGKYDIRDTIFLHLNKQHKK